MWVRSDRDGGLRSRVVGASVLEFRHDKIARETLYFNHQETKI
jgi:hypothetical protein